MLKRAACPCFEAEAGTEMLSVCSFSGVSISSADKSRSSSSYSAPSLKGVARASFCSDSSCSVLLSSVTGWTAGVGILFVPCPAVSLLLELGSDPEATVVLGEA